jgi:hypothetical protein
MIWIFLAVALGIFTYTSLGAMSVYLSMLTVTLKVLLFILSGGLLYFPWQFMRTLRASKTA